MASAIHRNPSALDHDIAVISSLFIVCPGDLHLWTMEHPPSLASLPNGEYNECCIRFMGSNVIAGLQDSST